MAEEIENQYYFSVDIGGYTEFKKNGGQITAFVIEEFAGGGFPVFEFAFQTADFGILASINEGTAIDCRFGPTSDETIDTVLTIQKFSYEVESATLLNVVTRGYVGDPGFLNFTEIKGWKSKPSSDVIKEVAGDYFTFKALDKFKPSSDAQNWIRYNIPANRFIHELWLHSYYADDNFMVYGINMKGEFLLGDYNSITSGAEKFTFDSSPEDTGAVKINPAYTISSNSGLSNKMGIYDRSFFEVDMITNALESKDMPKPAPVLASGSKLNITDKDVKRFGFIKMKTEHTHDNYNVSPLINVSNTLLHGSTEVSFETENKHEDYQLFDLVKFDNFQLDPDGKDTEMLSGLFVITRIARFWVRDNFRTALTISKDSMNSLKGDLL